ncbi:MAG: hypothetical protein AB1489_21245, partial [Acidobacteriota bacterium]
MDRENITFAPEMVVITREPLWQSIYTRIHYPLALLMLAIGFLILLRWPTPAGLSVPGQRAIAIFLLCLVMWLWGR